MTRPNKHIRPKKRGPAETFFGLKSGYGRTAADGLVW